MHATLRSQSFCRSRPQSKPKPRDATSLAISHLSSKLQKIYLRTPARSIITLAAAGGSPAGKTVLFTIGHRVP